MQLRRYLNEVLPAYREQRGSEDSFAAELAWQQVLNDGGWAAPSWPHWAGGRGLETRDRVECDLELADADAPMPAGILGLNNVGPTLIHFGTEEEQQRSLPRILSAEEIWCQGFSEPDAGSDLASLRTSARMDGEEFVVNGQKVWMSNGMEGTHCMVLVRTDPAAPKHQGISALLILFDTPGVGRRPLRQITAAEGFAEVFFTEVRMPVTALLGALNEGWAGDHDHARLRAVGRDLECGAARATGELAHLPDEHRRPAAARRDDQALDGGPADRAARCPIARGRCGNARRPARRRRSSSCCGASRFPAWARPCWISAARPG
jgi:alkylation response protein AidB-like acyl-CoA dehydrogenase